MIISFKAHAQSTDNDKVVLTFEIHKDFAPFETKIILLPDKQSEFKNLASLFDRYSNIAHPDLTKTKFQTGFINYTLSKLHKGASILNLHYAAFFEVDTSSVIMIQLQNMFQYKDSINAATQNNIDAYMKAKATQPGGIAPNTNDPAQPRPTGLDITVPSTKPSSSDQKPKVDMEGLSEAEIARLRSQPESLQASQAGLFGDKLKEPLPNYRQYAGETVIKGENNAWCILGRDFGKYGIDGSTQAGAAFLCAGLSPHDLKNVSGASRGDGNKGPGTNTLKKTRANLLDDAAFVYLSQKCDTDDLLTGVACGTFGQNAGSRTAESAAVMKADGVAIIARQSGIRLITGTDQKSTAGALQVAKYGIDIIAGNDDDGLQSMVKGENLIKYLEAVAKSLSHVSGIVYNFMTSQNTFNAVVMTHQHWAPVQIGLGSIGGLGPTGILGGKVPPSTECMQAGTKKVLEALKNQMNTINQSLNKINSELNALVPIGAGYILSAKNRVN